MSAHATSFADYAASSGPHLKRLAFLLTGDLTDAEDLLQSAYAKALPHWERIQTYDNPDAYLRRIMVNHRRSWWQRLGRRELAVEDVPISYSRPDPAGGVIDHLSLLNALRTLPVGQRRAVVLRHYCDLSEADTADVMQCSIGTVKSQTSRGLAALRQALRPDTEGEIR